MKPRFATLVALVLVLPLFAGCGEDKITADTTPPLAPILQGATMDESLLGAWWAPNTEPDLAGYNVYATQNGQTWQVNQGPLTDNYLVVQLENRTDPVQVYVTAYDLSANESSPSATLEANKVNVTPHPPGLWEDPPRYDLGQ